MTIEFMGLPGVGKSYLGKQVEKELSDCGIRCSSVVEKSRSTVGWRILSKCLHIIIPATPKYIRAKKTLVDLAYSYIAVQPKYNEDSVRVVDYIEQVAFLNTVYAKLQSSKAVYVFDEGIAQQFVNMIVNFNVDIEIIQSMLSFLDKLPKVVYMTYPIEKIKESITSRNRHVCYIDEIKDRELDKFLLRYQEACDMVSCIVNPQIIDRNNDGKLNLDIVLRETIG